MNLAPASTAAVRSASTPARLAAERAATERILFAFTPRERQIFMPGLRMDEFDAWPHACLDPETADTDAWESTLREWRPSVMVTAWSAKRIPTAWAASDDFPLRYVCHIAGSLRKILTRELLERGLRATNWGETITHTVAEHAMLLVLALLRGVPRWPASIAAGGWTLEQSQRLRTRSLRGLRVGLHGFGSVAREILSLLAPFRPAEVRVFSHGVPPAFISEYGAAPCAGLDELFASCDVLIDCESLSPQNRGSVGAHHLALLPDDAVFVNVGRGQVVEEEALLREAATGRLRIGVDVFHHEPLAPEHPLLRAPGVLVSPHIAGPTWDTYRLCGDHALENLRRHLAGRPLSGEVSPAAFERMT